MTTNADFNKLIGKYAMLMDRSGEGKIKEVCLSTTNKVMLVIENDKIGGEDYIVPVTEVTITSK